MQFSLVIFFFPHYVPSVVLNQFQGTVVSASQQMSLFTYDTAHIAQIFSLILQEQHSEKCIFMDHSFDNANQISVALIKLDLTSGHER